MKQLYFVDRKNLSKYIVMTVITVISIVLVLTINGVYTGYRRIQTENAYVYSGKWDIKTDGDVPALDVEPIGKLGGPDDYIDAEGGCYEIYACSKEEMEDLFAYELAAGRWPANDSELVLSEDFDYCGRSYKNGGLKMGSKISIESYQERDGKKEYTISGFHKQKVYNKNGYAYNHVFAGRIFDTKNVTCYYRLLSYDLKSISGAKHYFEGGAVSGTLNDYLYRAVYNSYGTDYIRHVDNGVKLLTWVLIILACGIVAISMTYVIDSEKKRNFKLYQVGCSVGGIFKIYAIRLVAIILLGCLFGVGITKFLIALLGKKLASVWQVFGDNINIKDISWNMLLVIAVTIFLCVGIYTFFCVQRQIRQDKSLRIVKQKRFIKTTDDLVNINIFNHKLLTAIFVVSLSVFMITSAYVAGFSKKISEKIAFATGKGNGCDFYISSDEDIYDDINNIAGVDEIYMQLGYCMCTTTLDEKNFIEEARKAYNYEDMASPDTYVYVRGLNEDYYKEFSKFNDLPPYDEILENGGCLVFNQFIDEEDGQVYDTFKWNGDEKITLKSTENDEAITVTPMANVSMPNFDRDVGFLLGSIFVPENKRRCLTDTEDGYNYDIYIDGKNINDTLAQLKQLADIKDCYFVDNSDEKVKQLDTYNTHMVIAGFIEIITLIIAVFCICSTVSLERLSRRKQYASYKLLGMSDKQLKELILNENIKKLIVAFGAAGLLTVLLYYKGSLARMAVFYSLGLGSVFMSLAIVFAVTLVLIYVISKSFKLKEI